MPTDAVNATPPVATGNVRLEVGPIRVAFYDGGTLDTNPRVAELEWSELVARLASFRESDCSCATVLNPKCSVKLRAPAWSPVDIVESRRNENVRAITAAVFDLDDADPEKIDGLDERLAGLAWIIHSTHSNTPESLCLRLVMPLSRPAKPHEWPAVRAAAVSRYGIPADPATKDLSRLYFLPDALRGTDRLTASSAGAPLDVEALLASAPAPLALVPAQQLAAPLTANEDALAARLILGTSKPDSRALLVRALRGKPLADLGTQDDTLNRLMSIVAFAAPDAPDDLVIQILRPCFQATNWLDGTEHLIGEALKKLHRARERKAEQDAAAERSQAAYAELDARFAPKTTAESEPPALIGNDGNGIQLADYPLTDAGNAERFVAEHSADLRFVPEWGQFIRWDGARWARTNDNPTDRGILTARRLLRAAEACGDSEKRAKLARHAIAMERAGALQAMLSIARTLPGMRISASDLDSDNFLFNCANGTVDLRTGALRTHRRDDFITKMTRVEYDPNAVAPQWERFLERILPSIGLRSYLQRGLGYSLTGDVREQALFFCHGAGANGKSTFLTLVQSIGGDYAAQGAPDLLMAKRGERHPAEIADLQGKRLVVCQEVESGQHFAETLIKQLTGGDPIKARLMRENWYQFNPTHKLIIAANHRPRARGGDYAFFRRMKLVLFSETIPPEERDPRLREKLEAEAPGILAWLVRGCLDWKQNGLGDPPEVVAATAEYRSEQDHLGHWIDARCERADGERSFTRDLYRDYKMWCIENGDHAWEQRSFSEGIEEHGFKRFRTKAAKGFIGLRLKSAGLSTTPPNGSP
jgi:P4 family phage/plasmid primase-like protien